MPPLHRVGDLETKVFMWLWHECEECDLPARYRATFLLEHCRTNPASHAYHHDDCSWCSDLEKFYCERHKYYWDSPPEGYESCSLFPLRRFPHFGWYKVEKK
jgi:hypothetical protein